MILLISVDKAQKSLAEATRKRRIATGLTQKGLSARADVKLATLRKFEQQGLISFESFLKLLLVLGGLERMISAVSQQEQQQFNSIDDVLKGKSKPARERGWRT